MKRSEELRQLLRQRPFTPFRVHLTDGRVYDVVCPEINLVGEAFVVIGITDPKNPDPWSEDWELVDMVDIQRVEPGSATKSVAAG
jgi:hypothetical protein